MNKAKIRLIPQGGCWRAQGPGQCYTVRSTPERAFGAYLLYYYGGNFDQYREDLGAGEWFVTRLPPKEATHLAMKLLMNQPSLVGTRAFRPTPTYPESRSQAARWPEDGGLWVDPQWPSHLQSEVEQRSYRNNP